MNPILQKLPKELRAQLRKTKMPSFEQPMLATLTKHYFSDEDWIYERKFDGARCLLFKDATKLYLKSRNNKKIDSTYPELITALQQQKADQIILDSEVISFKGKVSSFEQLQLRLGVQNPSPALMKKVKIYSYVFDILYLDGYDLTHLPLLTRKKILKQAVKFKDPLRYVEHEETEGLKFFKSACKKDWEGLIAKEKYGTYVHKRSRSWLKFKCIQEQELVIGGYTAPQRSRIGFGALLVGYYKGSKFMYAGKVGTGYSDEFLQKFIKQLKKITIVKNPFTNQAKIPKHAYFVKPYYVGEFRFEEWTKDNLLRQPRFLGLRADKKARDVVQELAKNVMPPSEH